MLIYIVPILYNIYLTKFMTLCTDNSSGKAKTKERLRGLAVGFLVYSRNIGLRKYGGEERLETNTYLRILDTNPLICLYLLFDEA